MKRSAYRAALAAATVVASSLASSEAALATIVANGGAIEVRDNARADPYPSRVTVPGGVGTVTKVSVTLKGVTHGCPIDLDVQLVSPTGASVILMSDAGAPPGGGCPDAAGVDLTFDDEAPAALPDRRLRSGTFRPADYDEDDPQYCGGEEGGPAPGLRGATSLGAFDGADPAGEWQLYVVDDCVDDAGSIDGWTLEIGTTESPFADLRPPVLSGLAVRPRCVSQVELGAPGPATLSARYRLSEDATVAYVIGRRIESPARDRCPERVRAGSPGRYETVGSLEERAPAGTVDRELGGRAGAAALAPAGKNSGGKPRSARTQRSGWRSLSLADAFQRRRLAPGTYLLMVVAHDAAGNRSAVARAKFWVLRGD